MTLSVVLAAGALPDQACAAVSFPPAPPTTPTKTVDADPRRAVDLSMHGPDLSDRGRSLFDDLFLVEDGGEWRYEIPFPFAALVKEIEARFLSPISAGSRVRQVLFPLGRSLRPQAAAPDFFRYPRVVAAIVSESEAVGVGPLKDGLFLGDQERAHHRGDQLQQ